MSETQKTKSILQRAGELLEELPKLKPHELADWNMRAESLCVFAAIENLKNNR
jgi:hypothetical protein